MKNWTVREALTDEQDPLVAYPELIRRLLHARNLSTPEAAEAFLNPSYERDLHDPELMLGLKKARDRILTAIDNDERITIFADYDADGVPGACVLAAFLKKVNFTNFDVYIPDRHLENYGLSLAALNSIAAGGTKLVITIDCGITNVAEVKAAHDLGMEVIITDHHLPTEALPEAIIVDSKQAGDPYPYKMLCGCGVVYKLVQALIKALSIRKDVVGLVPDGWEKWLLDLVAIATVSDMVPLDGENRALAHFGLRVLRQGRRAGIRALVSSSGLAISELGEDDISFTLGPRINVASRMLHASHAYNLLTTENLSEAQAIAKLLESKNSERRRSVDKILKAVDVQLSAAEPPAVIGAGDPSWSLGVLGLAASRIAEKYRRPVFVWGKNGNGELKGSCRSDGTVNIVGLMEAAGGNGFFLNYGGHAQAGGFSVTADKESELIERLCTAYAALPKAVMTDDEFLIDAELSLDEVTPELFSQVLQFAPFGIGNPKPIFMFRGVTVWQARTFGNGDAHLELIFRKNDGSTIKAVGFFATYSLENLNQGDKIDLLATLEKSFYRSRGEYRLRIVDIRPAS